MLSAREKSLDIKLDCNNISIYQFKYKTCIKIFLEIHLLLSKVILFFKFIYTYPVVTLDSSLMKHSKSIT